MGLDLFKLPVWLREQVFYRAKLNAPEDLDSGGPAFPLDKEYVKVKYENANLIGSETKYGWHKPILDLDVEHWYVPSSTPGHAHLYLNKDLPENGLREIVEVLGKWGILQEGIVRQLDREESITVRAPGMKKGNPTDDASLEELLELKFKDK